MIFLSKHLVVTEISLTFAAKMIFSINDNKMCTVMQRNFDFSASFNAYYLVNPNNLLTHTHTHLAHLAFKRLHVRAREARVTPINKGLLGVPFVRNFVSLYEQKMNEIRERNVGTHGSCVRSPRLSSCQLTSHWSGRTSRASLHAFANKKTQKEANEKTQEHVGTQGKYLPKKIFTQL